VTRAAPAARDRRSRVFRCGGSLAWGRHELTDMQAGCLGVRPTSSWFCVRNRRERRHHRVALDLPGFMDRTEP
jgi:hypothetical protein